MLPDQSLAEPSKLFRCDGQSIVSTGLEEPYLQGRQLKGTRRGTCRGLLWRTEDVIAEAEGGVDITGVEKLKEVVVSSTIGDGEILRSPPRQEM